MNAFRIARISSISICLLLSAVTFFPAFASSALRKSNPSSVAIKSSQIAEASESEEDVLLPNVKSRAELQDRFNTTMRSEKVKFEGFEGRPLLIHNGPTTGAFSGKINYILTCADGYFTQTSPKGKRICDAYITVMRTMRSTEDRTSSTTELSKNSMEYGPMGSRNDSCIWR